MKSSKEWERVQRMRREHDPLVKGGHYHEVPDFGAYDGTGKGMPNHNKKKALKPKKSYYKKKK
jgi:hypothetical protein